MVAGDPALIYTFQEPEKEKRRRAHPLPLKTVSSTCISLLWELRHMATKSCKGNWQMWSILREKYTQQNVRLIWKRRGEWIFNGQEAVFVTDLFQLQSLHHYHFWLISLILKVTGKQTFLNTTTVQTFVVFKCRLLCPAFLGSSSCLSAAPYELSKQVMCIAWVCTLFILHPGYLCEFTFSPPNCRYLEDRVNFEIMSVASWSLVHTKRSIFVS